MAQPTAAEYALAEASNPYECLGVAFDAEDDDIKHAYRKLVLKCASLLSLTESVSHELMHKVVSLSGAFAGGAARLLHGPWHGRVLSR